MTRAFDDLDALKEATGELLGFSRWVTVTQSQIDAFAAATGDEQWIHTDEQRAALGPFGSTIAHGYLTLSMVPAFSRQIYTVGNLAMGVNYGANRLRFPAPVLVGSRLRASATLLATEDIAIGTRVTTLFEVEREGGDKLVMIAEILQVLAPRP